MLYGLFACHLDNFGATWETVSEEGTVEHSGLSAYWTLDARPTCTLAWWTISCIMLIITADSSVYGQLHLCTAHVPMLLFYKNYFVFKTNTLSVVYTSQVAHSRRMTTLRFTCLKWCFSCPDLWLSAHLQTNRRLLCLWSTFKKTENHGMIHCMLNSAHRELDFVYISVWVLKFASHTPELRAAKLGLWTF